MRNVVVITSTIIQVIRGIRRMMIDALRIITITAIVAIACQLLRTKFRLMGSRPSVSLSRL